MELADQFRGALLALAVGDALGATADGLQPARLRAEHGVLRDMLGGGPAGLRPGQAGTATELMLCVLESYNVRGAFDPQEIIDCLVEAVRSPRIVLDPMTALAMRQLADGWHFEPAAQLAYAAATPAQRLSGYALPRVIPPGLLHYHDDLHLIGESRVVSGFTHQAELAKLCATALNLALQHMLLVGTGGLLEELLVWVQPRSAELYDWLRVVPRLRPERLDNSGSAPSVLQAALWASIHVTELEEGLLLLVNRGGSASLLGAVGGAMLGARFGWQGLPERWLERLELRTTLDRMADRLFFLSQQADLPLKLLAETGLPPLPADKLPPGF